MGRVSHYGFKKSPRKGSRLRAFLIACLGNEGICGPDATEIIGDGASVAVAVNNLRDQKGWDVRSFKRHGVRSVTYRCVGKMRWDGSYRSFVKP